MLSNLFMELSICEKDLNTTFAAPVMWYKYVDDIFAVTPQDTDTKNILRILNSNVQLIKYYIRGEKKGEFPVFGYFVEMGTYK